MSARNWSDVQALHEPLLQEQFIVENEEVLGKEE